MGPTAVSGQSRQDGWSPLVERTSEERGPTTVPVLAGRGRALQMGRGGLVCLRPIGPMAALSVLSSICGAPATPTVLALSAPTGSITVHVRRRISTAAKVSTTSGPSGPRPRPALT